MRTSAAAAVPAKPVASAEEQIHELEERGRQLCAAFHKTAKVAGLIERGWLIGTIKKVQEMFTRLGLEIR